MKTKDQVCKRAAKLNVEIDHVNYPGYWDVSIWAPHGKVFNATGGQVCCACTPIGSMPIAEYWQQVWDDLITLEDAPIGFESEIYDDNGVEF